VFAGASCLALAGGNYAAGSSAGVFWLNVDNNTSYSNSGVGSRLMYL
jgi:hypothetical protein